MPKENVKVIITCAIILLVLFFLLSYLFPPLFQKKIKEINLKEIKNKEFNFNGSSERIRCIDDNVDALIWRLRLIEEAKEDLTIATFNIEDKESGKDIMAALVGASLRGVKIRILVDGLSEFLDLKRSSYFHTLANLDNVQVKIYNPIKITKPWKTNYRMHDKYFIADKQLYILGGRNIKNLSLGDYQKQVDIDRDILVYSPSLDDRESLEELEEYFESIWSYCESEKFKISSKNKEKSFQELQDHYLLLKDSYPQAFEPIDWVEETFEVEGICLLSNPINAGNKEPILWKTLVNLMKKGEDINIQTPYIILNKMMYKDLDDIANEDRQVKIITNSVESGANIFGTTDYLNQKNKIRSTGSHIFEYCGEKSSHTKTIVIDDRISLVGSFNFDMRSTYLSTELMLYIDSPILNQHLRQINDEHMARSRQIFPDGRSIAGEKYEKKEMSILKKIIFPIVRLIILPLRHLL